CYFFFRPLDLFRPMCRRTLLSRARVDTLCQSPPLKAIALTHISMPNTPPYILSHGRNTGKDKQGKIIWMRIGAVWPNTSGTGLHLTWDDLPLGDGLTVMLPFNKEGGESAPPKVEHELCPASSDEFSLSLEHLPDTGYGATASSLDSS